MTDILIAPDVKLGKSVILNHFVNLYGCEIGDGTKIGTFVEIQKGAIIGKNCKISSHTFICEGIEIGNGCFIGHGVMFINDNYPRAVNAEGTLESESDWKSRMGFTKVGHRVTVGSNTTILCNITIGDGALIGAGSVITRSVPPNEIWAGNPARFIRIRPQQQNSHEDYFLSRS